MTNLKEQHVCIKICFVMGGKMLQKFSKCCSFFYGKTKGRIQLDVFLTVHHELTIY